MPVEQELRLHRCCFTGHRPEKLNTPETVVKAKLEEAIRQAVADGYTTFISGMARGVDIWAAQIVLKLRANNPAIRLIAAVPYKGFEERWSKLWQDQFNFILEYADLVKYICKGYSMTSFQIRNEWMVDHSNRVIAVFNGELGGTKNTIDYATTKQIDVVRL